jgi:hypothetical protein
VTRPWLTEARAIIIGALIGAAATVAVGMTPLFDRSDPSPTTTTSSKTTITASPEITITSPRGGRVTSPLSVGGNWKNLRPEQRIWVANSPLSDPKSYYVSLDGCKTYDNGTWNCRPMSLGTGEFHIVAIVDSGEVEQEGFTKGANVVATVTVTRK